MAEPLVCSACGCVLDAGYTSVGNDNLCPNCTRSLTVMCDCCGQRIYASDNHGNFHTPLCHNCFENYFTSCDSCGRLIANEDALYTDDYDDTPFCSDCYNRMQGSREIHDYYYKPYPIFYGEGKRYMGVELEIDCGGEVNSKAREILSVCNSPIEHIYCKHDGSLDDGFEIVSHPMSLEYHTKNMPWADVLQSAVRQGYLSHQARTCGLHVHVNRGAFGATESEQDAVIARILFFFEKHWDELLKFSRRTKRQLERWAARYGYKEQPKEILDYAKKGYGAGRYSCVNLLNRETIEFRMFRGTLKYNTFIATLQLVNKICDVALSLSDEEIKELSWTSFVSCIQEAEYPELVSYLKERRLYINDAISAEEEI